MRRNAMRPRKVVIAMKTRHTFILDLMNRTGKSIFEARFLTMSIWIGKASQSCSIKL